MANRTMGRITFPQNPAELLELAKKIHDKYVADGETSPLNAMEDYDWSIEAPKIVNCKQNHDDAEEAASKAERHYRQRDIDLAVIKEIVRNSASLLKSIYAKNPKVLSDHGFEVMNSRVSKTTASQA